MGSVSLEAMFCQIFPGANAVSSLWSYFHLRYFIPKIDPAIVRNLIALARFELGIIYIIDSCLYPIERIFRKSHRNLKYL